ncbi:hypothetical protein [Arthrobacter sp. M2012083]|nr:hypothetical protein [Arthrobacter sp. M2012083]
MSTLLKGVPVTGSPSPNSPVKAKLSPGTRLKRLNIPGGLGGWI